MDPQKELHAFIASLRSDLPTYVGKCFNTVEPATFIHNWHIDAMSEYLMACMNGQIRRLIINIPPGYTKSIMVNVGFSTFLLGHKPETRVLSASHTHDLALSMSNKARDVMNSDWYKCLFPETKLRMEVENRQDLVKTTVNGERRAVSFNGKVTGKSGDYIIVDDPTDAQAAWSETEVTKANRWYDTTLYPRLRDKRNGVIIIIMQRLHENDLTGHLLESGQYEHLKLPVIAEKKTIISFGDFHKERKEGELLFPAYEDQAVLDETKKSLGTLSFEGQYQQNPVSPEGNLAKREHFKIMEVMPEITREVRRWDLAGSIDGDYTVGIKMAKTKRKTYIITAMTRFKATPGQVEETIKGTAVADGRNCHLIIPQDPGQAGKAQADYYIKQLAGYKIKAIRETGSKIARFMPFVSQLEAGNIELLKGEWNSTLIDELCFFPNGKNDDIVDACAGAFQELALENDAAETWRKLVE